VADVIGIIYVTLTRIDVLVEASREEGRIEEAKKSLERLVIKLGE